MSTYLSPSLVYSLGIFRLWSTRSYSFPVFCLISYKHSESCSIHVQLCFQPKTGAVPCSAACCISLPSGFQPLECLQAPVCVLSQVTVMFHGHSPFCCFKLEVFLQTHLILLHFFYCMQLLYFTSWSLQQPNKQVHQLHFLNLSSTLCHVSSW